MLCLVGIIHSGLEGKMATLSILDLSGTTVHGYYSILDSCRNPFRAIGILFDP